MNHSDDNLISSSQGNRKNCLHRHTYDAQDGQEMSEFYNRQETSQDKRFISQTMGESMGDKYVTEKLGYQVVFHGDEKSIYQGIDGLYRDSRTNELVIVEFKGQNSCESKLQKRHDWSIETCKKITHPHPPYPYSQASEYEQSVAREILRNYDAGNRIRYEVIRTEIDLKTNELTSQLEKQTYLEQGLEQSYPVQDISQEGLTQDMDWGMSL
ncbi:MAG: hypothetical protein AAGG00_01440 [Cyanobacteria bacterium P01_H01_bin.150]